MELTNNIQILKPTKKLDEGFQTEILDDFFNMHDLMTKSSEDKSWVTSMYKDIVGMLATRLYLDYQNANLRNDNADYKNILADNDLCLEETTEILKELKEKNHNSFADVFTITQLEKKLSSARNVLKGYIYYAPERDQLTESINESFKNIFNVLKRVKMGLGTKTLSKGSTNYDVALTSYRVICDKDINHKFVNGTSSKESEYLAKKLSSEEYERLRVVASTRNLPVESLLLSFIILKNFYKFDTEVLENYFAEEELENLEEAASEKAEEVLDSMCYRMVMKIE